jgi:methyl-accepting chemotaxis protein
MGIVNLKIKARLILICVALVSIPLLILGIILYSTIENETQRENEVKLKQQAQLITLNVQNIYEIAEDKVQSDLQVAKNIVSSYGSGLIDQSGQMVLIDREKEEFIQKKVNSDLIIANKIFYSSGSPVLNRDKRISVTITNQITKKTESLSIPVLEQNNSSLAFNYEIVDSIKKTTGVETATIFQTIPRGLLRISTNVFTLDGKRAVGTYIPEDSLVYETVMKGETFFGRAFVVNSWYQTAYEPIFDKNRNVIGVLYVGAKESRLIVNGNNSIVDEIQSLIGGTATIFQLKDFEGENANDPTSRGWNSRKAFYRISTNVIKENGERAINTIVSKPVYDTVLKGESFYGRAWVVNNWYMTAYDPLKNEQGEIIGILFVGVKESDFQEKIEKTLASVVVGKSGYIFILNDKGDYILSYKQGRDGENIWNVKDSQGNFFVQNIISSALTLDTMETELLYYPWQNSGESESRMKFAGYSYFAPWNWIIASSAYVDDFEDSLNQIRNIILLLCFIGVFLGVIISYLFAQSISRPLRQVTLMADSIARGDLNIEKLNIQSKDEIRELSDSFSKMIDSFQYKADVLKVISGGDLTGQIVKASEKDQLGQSLIEMKDSLNDLLHEISQTIIEVTNGAENVSEAGQHLSRGAIDQASSLEEISSSLSRINGQSRVNAENAMEASSLAKTASLNAEQGNRKMNELMLAMNKINDSSDKISKVVKVIDDIAFQINLLALNANVEAARAGKYGKGFAVVADEVRNLANRSAEAAKETSTMMEVTIKNVNEGKDAAEDTAKQLKEILSGAVKVADFLLEIAQSSNEQAQGVENINIGLEQIDKVTQSNSSSAEESASAGEELAAQALQLKSMIEMFQLDDSYQKNDKALSISYNSDDKL